MRLPGTFLNQLSDTKIKVKIGQNLKIKSTVKGLKTGHSLITSSSHLFALVFPFVLSSVEILLFMYVCVCVCYMCVMCCMCVMCYVCVSCVMCVV